MNTSNILNVLLAVALVILSVKIAFSTSDSTNVETDPSTAVINNIMTRTSIRAYQDKPVEEEKIHQLLQAGMAAPSAKNKQPWSFVVVKKKEILQQFTDDLPFAKMASQAPMALVVCGDLTKAMEGESAAYWIQDASAATENILLAAHGLGLGAVWTGVYPGTDRVKSVSDILNLPEHIIPLCVIPIGYPAESPAPKNKWKEENVHYDGWH